MTWRLKAMAVSVLVTALLGLDAPSAEASMRGGARVSPPSGLVDFCRRLPGECASGQSLAYHAPAETVAMQGQDATSAIGGSAPTSPAFSLRRGAAEPAGRAVVLSEPRWKELNAINGAVNAAIEAQTDDEAFGVAEHWTLPLTIEGRAVGDCEDYALEKRRLLLARGWPADTLMMATAFVPSYGRHAVLVVRTDRGDLVLDNLVDPIRHWDVTGYRWQARQAGADLRHWVSVGR